MPASKTVDDIEPIAGGAPGHAAPPQAAAQGGTVPEAPASAAVRPEHLAAAARPGQSAQNRAAASHLAAGTVIDGKYAIVRLLGQGGMGVVYLARDIHTDIDVVLKAVRSELAHRADVRARTLAEGRVLGQIDHPNVVHLKAVVVDDKSLWLVMQYIDGESLERTIERHNEQKKPMPLAEALRFFRQIVSGIAAAHAEGVIHRDLKPANVLIRAKDRVAKVTDFGIAKAEHDTGAGRVQTRGVIGSIWYMSPEQVTGRRDLDKRVDIYALGILLYQMLTGRVPFDAESDIDIMRAQVETPLPLAAKLRPDLPPSVDALLQKLCAKSRDDRFATCDDVLAAVEDLEAEVGIKPTIAPRTHLGTIGPQPTQGPVAAAKSASGADAIEPTAHKSEPPKPGSVRPDASEHDTEVDPPPALPKARSRVGLWIALGFVLAAAGVAALFATGVIRPARWLQGPLPSARPTASAKAPVTATASAAPSLKPSAGVSATATASAAPSVPPYERLAGEWLGSSGDRALIAVKIGDTVEFRVKDPAQFAPADYEAGETRFVLRRVPGEETVFAVEDRLRPNPPIHFPFNRDRARPSCQEVRSEAGGSPLRATLEGARLSVELMKIEPTKGNFLFEKDKTVSCVGLGKLKASKLVSVLTRK